MSDAACTEPAWRQWHDDDEPIRIGISSCLLGQQVRYDGGHKHDRYLTGVLGRWVSWVPVCPEVDIGLPIPRPTIRLEIAQPVPRLIMPSTGQDLSTQMQQYAEAKVGELKALQLDGYVLKKGSPSCGLERVRVWAAKGAPPARNGVGAYTRVLLERWPGLPIEEEGRLNDPALRERFIEHVFCHHRWRSMQRHGLTRGRLVAFHTAHKMLLRAHNEAAYRRLGRIVANPGNLPDEQLFAAYQQELAVAMASTATSKRHSNVLYHALGYLKRQLGPGERQELVQLIEGYRQGLVPLIVPVTLLRHHVSRHQVPYLLGQLYLEPHPKELMLRNRV